MGISRLIKLKRIKLLLQLVKYSKETLTQKDGDECDFVQLGRTERYSKHLLKQELPSQGTVESFGSSKPSLCI